MLGTMTSHFTGQQGEAQGDRACQGHTSTQGQSFRWGLSETEAEALTWSSCPRGLTWTERTLK